MNKEDLMLLKTAVLSEINNLNTKMGEAKSIEEYSQWKNLYNKYSIILDKLQ